MQETITILVNRSEEAFAELKKLAKKANRYGNDPVSYQIGTPYKAKRDSRLGGDIFTVEVDVVDIVLDYGTIEVGNFEFIARIDLSEGAAIIDTVPGKEVPEQFRNTDNRCEHCNINRYRKDVFIVREKDTGNFVQVGRTCLKDYLGQDPTEIIARFNFIKEAKGFNDFGGGVDWVDTLRGVLVATSAEIRLHGWVSGKQAKDSGYTIQSTADEIKILWSNVGAGKAYEIRKRLENEIRDEDFVFADKVIHWVREEMKGDNDYLYNLRTVFANDLVSWKRVGLVASAVAGYYRYLEQQEKAAKSTSNHVGEIKQRLRGLKLRCDFSTGLDSFYGAMTLYKFHDESGNVFVWFKSGLPDGGPEIGQTVVVDGTVKKHDDYQGIKQTVLNRVKGQGSC